MHNPSTTNIKFSNAIHKLKILGLAGLLTASSLKAHAAEPKTKETTETVSKKAKTTTAQKLSLTKAYKIRTKQDFNKLWNDAKPFCVPVLVLSENWRLDFHHDRGKKATPNSVCAGLYYYPANGNFSSTKWILTKQYVERYQKTHRGKNPKNRNPSDIRDGVYGWGESMENGRHLNELYKTLKGTELTINEFVAIYSRYFHTGDLDAAKKIASIKKSSKIKDKPLECAKVLLDIDKPSLPGQKSRFMHEALVFLNEDDYCHDLFSLYVDCHLGSSINACPGQYKNVCNGKLTHAKAKTIKTKICDYMLPNGKQIKYLCGKINDKNIMAFCITTTNTKKLDERDALYQKAMDAYNKQNYKLAKQYFVQVIEKNGEGPDLWNDIAITYYNLGEYNNCIEMCRKILMDKDAQQEYAKACFNAGKAYEAQKNYKKALDNYKAALNHYNKYGIADRNPDINYAGTYQAAINRVEPKISTKNTHQKNLTTKKSTPKKTQQQKKASSKKATTPQKKGKGKKAALAFLIGANVLQKKSKKELFNKLIKDKTKSG